MKRLKNWEKLFVPICLGMTLFVSKESLAEGSPIYYDSFYEDYYKAFPDTKS